MSTPSPTGERERLIEAVKAEYDKCMRKWDGQSEPAALETIERLFAGDVVLASAPSLSEREAAFEIQRRFARVVGTEPGPMPHIDELATIIARTRAPAPRCATCGEVVVHCADCDPAASALPGEREALPAWIRAAANDLRRIAERFEREARWGGSGAAERNNNADILYAIADRLDTLPVGEEAAPAPPSGVRPSVAAFALAMEERLRRHDDTRGTEGWMGDSSEALLVRLMDEVGELSEVIGRHAVAADWIALRGEAADVANFAMMIADASGSLESLKPRATALPEREALTVRVAHLIYGNYRSGLLGTVAPKDAPTWDFLPTLDRMNVMNVAAQVTAAALSTGEPAAQEPEDIDRDWSDRFRHFALDAAERLRARGWRGPNMDWDDDLSEGADVIQDAIAAGVLYGENAAPPEGRAEAPAEELDELLWLLIDAVASERWAAHQEGRTARYRPIIEKYRTRFSALSRSREAPTDAEISALAREIAFKTVRRPWEDTESGVRRSAETAAEMILNERRAARRAEAPAGEPAGYESWRISFQSSEQAARAAYAHAARYLERITKLVASAQLAESHIGNALSHLIDIPPTREVEHVKRNLEAARKAMEEES